MLPYVTAFIAVICYAAIGPVIKKAGLELPTFLVIGISSTMLAIGAFAILFFSQGKAGFIVPSRSDFFGFLAFTCLNLLGWALYMYSIKLIPVAQYDMIAGFGILLTACFAALLLKEPIHFRYLPAAFFILVGLLIAIGPDLRAK
jgi:drug/metabolite transporter (DMT)-like permease